MDKTSEQAWFIQWKMGRTGQSFQSKRIVGDDAARRFLEDIIQHKNPLWTAMTRTMKVRT